MMSHLQNRDQLPSVCFYCDDDIDLDSLRSLCRPMIVKSLAINDLINYSPACFCIDAASQDVASFLREKNNDSVFKKTPVILLSKDFELLESYVNEDIDDFYFGPMQSPIFFNKVKKILSSSKFFQNNTQNNSPNHSTNNSESELNLAFMAYYDPLTGLLNKLQFHSYLEHQINKSGNFFSVMFVDLDGFKLVNDQFGHTYGDWVITQTAYRLKHGLKRNDLVARLGGDEFGLVLDQVECPFLIKRIATRILNYVSSPYINKSRIFNVSASIGISRFPKDATSIDQLIRNADKAMYKAKKNGKNTYQIYSI